MKALKKGQEASEENVHVKINGTVYRCANLKEKGITINSKILIAHNDVWHELYVIGLGKTDTFEGLKTSNIYNFKNLVEQAGVIPKLPFSTETGSVKNYELTHEDRMMLDEKYGFSYVYIEKLEAHLARFKMKTGMYNVSEILKHLKKQGRTIQEYILNCEEQSKLIINKSNKIIKMGETESLQTQRIEYLESIGFTYDEPNSGYVLRYGTIEAPAMFLVSLRGIEEDTEEAWEKTLMRIAHSLENQKNTEGEFTPEVQQAEEAAAEALPAVPVMAEAPAKKPLSLQTIGDLKPDRFIEFQNLKEIQEKAVKDNPYIKPTDKDSFAKAKKAASNLLKASTTIDGPKDGIKANKNRYLKQLGDALDSFLNPLAKMTRDAYDKQKLANDAWESAEKLRLQNEEKARLEKVNKRTQKLFDVPMVFNGTHYFIGNLYIMPSQITSATDEDFSALVAQAQGIKAGIDAAAKANEEKDKEIERLKAELARLTGTAPAIPAVTEGEGTAKTQNTGPTANTIVQPAKAANTIVTDAPASAPKPEVISPVLGEYIYIEPNEDNKLLLAFDLENIDHVGKQAFLKCREFYKRGLRDAGKEINSIFGNVAIEKKAGPLKDLGKTLSES